MDGKGGNGVVAVSGGSDPYLAGGGAGNPAGTSNKVRGGSYSINAENGTGGLLIIYSKKLINNSYIISNGSKGGYVYPSGGGIAGGGSSGAGSINLFYIDNLEKGNILAEGIAKGTNHNGGAGGNGSITMGNIATGTFVKENE